MTQTMLLTVNLTDFLSKNTNSTIPTMLLLSQSGKLLSSSSSLPASRLRTQATLSYSLWTLYFPSVKFISTALPPLSDRTMDKHELSTITIQLTQGLMMIRALNCGLVFVAINSSDLVTSVSASLSKVTSPPTSSRGGDRSDLVIDTETPKNVGSQAADIVQFRKLAEEVGKWLDRQLVDFALYEGDGRL